MFYVCSYKKYVFLDPLAGAVTKTHNALETEKEEKPFDAPLSITKREQLERQVHARACRRHHLKDNKKIPPLSLPFSLHLSPSLVSVKARHC